MDGAVHVGSILELFELAKQRHRRDDMRQLHKRYGPQEPSLSLPRRIFIHPMRLGDSPRKRRTNHSRPRAARAPRMTPRPPPRRTSASGTSGRRRSGGPSPPSAPSSASTTSCSSPWPRRRRRANCSSSCPNSSSPGAHAREPRRPGPVRPGARALPLLFPPLRLVMRILVVAPVRPPAPSRNFPAKFSREIFSRNLPAPFPRALAPPSRAALSPHSPAPHLLGLRKHSLGGRGRAHTAPHLAQPGAHPGRAIPPPQPPFRRQSRCRRLFHRRRRRRRHACSCSRCRSRRFPPSGAPLPRFRRPGPAAAAWAGEERVS